MSNRHCLSNPLFSTLPHPTDTATVDGWRVQLVCSLDIWVPLTSPVRIQVDLLVPGIGAFFTIIKIIAHELGKHLFKNIQLIEKQVE